MKNNKHLWSYPLSFLVEWKMFQTKVVDEINTHILCSVNFFARKSRCLWDNVGKYTTAGETTDENMVQALFILGT